jgi:hypothetical protein
MSSTSIKCLFCEHTQTRSTPFEDTVFNNKTFEYVQCTKCDLIFVNPLPDTDDLIKMYPVEYQGNLAIAASGLHIILCLVKFNQKENIAAFWITVVVVEDLWWKHWKKDTV